jgi:hypothetical protein
LGSGPLKKKRLVLASKHKQHAPSDQVTPELFLYHAPHCSLGLVAVKLVFRCLFEALQCLTQATKINTSAWANTQPAKRLWVLLMRRMLTPKFVTVDLCFIACEFFLNSQDSSDRRKPSVADPSKKLAQRASSSHATPVASSTGVTSSTTLSATEAWDYCQWAA